MVVGEVTNWLTIWTTYAIYGRVIIYKAPNNSTV